MTKSQTHPEGWISLYIAPEFEVRAKEIRAERDKKYQNLYEESATDERWVGDLGEMVFNSWLKHEGLEGFSWILDDAAGQPDFVTSLNVRIGVKTVKRKVPPRLEYTAQITARHVDEPIDHYFFMSYEVAKKKMWLLGGIEHDSFIALARRYNAGEWVHPQYQIRAGHEIYNIEISKLTPPALWVASIQP